MPLYLLMVYAKAQREDMSPDEKQAATAMTDAEEALELIRSNPNHFDLVIADRSMPQLSGYKLAELLLEICPHVPVIIVSGHAEEPGLAEARPSNIRWR